MAALTPSALATLIAGMKPTDRIHVRVKDKTGHRYMGHVADLLHDSANPDNSTCTIVSADDEIVWNVPVRRIEWVDVRPIPDGH